jgi:hypothetical protein
MSEAKLSSTIHSRPSRPWARLSGLLKPVIEAPLFSTGTVRPFATNVDTTSGESHGLMV